MGRPHAMTHAGCKSGSRGSHQGRSGEPVFLWALASGMLQEDTPVAVSYGPSPDMSPRYCKQMCSGRWDTLVCVKEWAVVINFLLLLEIRFVMKLVPVCVHLQALG